MTQTFFKFPSTPHLSWLGEVPPRADKVLTSLEADHFLDHEISVEEKVDGANVGFSLDENGSLRVQNRGGYLEHPAHPQFRPLWPWLEAHRTDLTNALGWNLVLFGEWCFATHSVRYDALPDWLLGFDLYDKTEKQFWASDRRDAWFHENGIVPVPRLARGRLTCSDILGLLGQSRLGSELMEGLYLRRDNLLTLEQRAKLVRPDFLQAIDEHWSKRPLRKNCLSLEAESSGR